MALMGLMTVGVSAQRVTDKIDRGVVVVPTSSGGYFLSWRKFGEEYYDTKYNVYRNGTLYKSDLTVTNCRVSGATNDDTYEVEAVVNGQAQPKSAPVKPWTQTWFDVPVLPVVNRAGHTIGNSRTDGATTTSGYTLNDISLADVTGDGVCEFIVKRNNSQGNLRSKSNNTDFNLYECYKLDGTRLWWIDLGPILMAGPDEQWDMIGYDWDMDGKAEMIMRGADNMIIHTATGKTINIGNMQAGLNVDRPEYMGVGNEYLLYLNGETGEPYGWDGSENWTPDPYPLPQFEAGEANSDAIWGDRGHRMMKHYFGAPYLDGVHPSIFLGRGAYTRHKFCALDVDPATHKLTQRWRWNCYDSKSPWYGNGFHNYQIADVDMDGRDEIMFGSMCIDDTGFGLTTTGLGHGDAQHVGDLDPYRWGLEQFTCQEGSQGNSYWCPATGQIYYRKSDGGDDGRALAGNFSNTYPGGQGRSVSSGVIGLSCDKVILPNGDAMSGSYANLNMRIYWDGDLLDEILNSAGGEGRPAAIFKWGGSRIWTSEGAVHNNSSKCNPSAQGDILGDWREEVVLRTADNSAMRIFTTTTSTEYPLYTLWHDHQYRNAMAWQCIGYNQPPHPSFFVGELENITIAPPPLIVRGRTEVKNSITSTTDHLLVSGYENKTITVADGAEPYILTVNAPAWVKGSGSQQATASTPKVPTRTVETFTTTLTGGAFAGGMRLVKQGEGVLVLPTVTEKYTGETNVWQGTLQFDGTMEASPVWLNRHTTLVSNGGQFKGGLKADYNATIYPGGKDNVGAVSASTLALGFGSRIVFDVKGGQLDQVNAEKLTIETKDWEYGPKYRTPVFQFVGVSEWEDGRYALGAIGAVEGGLENILVEGVSGKRFTLEVENGTLYLVIEGTRGPATLFWNGTNENSIWDLAVTKNFLLNSTPDFSVDGDDLIFNDEAESGKVTVKGAVSPSAITVDNDQMDYTLSGDGIQGKPTLVKSGKGRLTITNENQMGATTINGGTVTVNALANNTGVACGALGDVSQTITLNDGSALAVSMPVITDQQINVSGNVMLSTPSGISFTINKGLKGADAVITKTGAGTLTTGSSNTYAKLIIRDGSVNCSVNNNKDQLPKTVEFVNGTLTAGNNENTNIDNSTNFVVEKGMTGTFYGGFRSTYTGKLTGEGTFNAYTGGVRCYFNGDWSEFSGTLNIGKNNRQNKKSYDPTFMLGNTKGLPLATVNVNEKARLDNQGKNIVVKRLGGKGAVVGSGQWIIDNDENFSLTTEVGITSERKDDYGGTIAKSASPLTKRGSGKMTVTAGNINGALTVGGGTVTFNNAALSTLVNGAYTVTVKDTGRVVGQGLVNAVSLQKGGELTPCGSTFVETTPGTIKCNNTINVNEGAAVNFLVNATKNSTLDTKNLTFNGTLRIVIVNDALLAEGRELKLWTVSGTFSGTPKLELSDRYTWDTSRLATEGILVVAGQSTGVAAVKADADACNVYDLQGRLVSRQANATSTEGLRPGLYVRGGKKVVVK